MAADTGNPYRVGGASGTYSAASSPNVIQRVSLESKKWRIFYRSNTVPTSWTTVVTGAKSTAALTESPKTLFTWASFVATDATAYTLQMRIQDPAGNNAEIAQGQTAADGDQFRPLNSSNIIPLPPDWKLQIIGSGAGTVNVDVLIAGYEERVSQ